MKRSIVNKSLSDQIHEALRDLIIKGELKPGDRILELEIARDFGVSQAPVREALLKLAEEDLVVSIRYKGTFVSNISMVETEELYCFRIIMEELAIKRSLERLKAGDLRDLDNFYHEMVRAGETNDLDSLRVADINFHSKIFHMAEHKFMYSVWETLVSKLNRIWYLTSQACFINLSEVAAIHEPFLNAIKSHDLNGCIKALHEHIDYEKKKSFN
ncbi:GntR family transcriptional regulator [Neobacillus cucumis]|uniref:GntR family transcriptional regulator n=1 Tax=Neobacillus cucumis TaxID=1740721 RepID=UPI00285346EE|nr:GntR family transcriptional regulator [Neobacillus cucumis]MDR4949378.1 GntR family transcriptional regulator [Neobacillus cucumis]